MLIVFAFVIVPVSFLIAAVAVDASVWQSERRGAQKDADLAALAGVLELTKPVAGDADAAARASLTTNDEEGTGGSKSENIITLTVDNSCFPSDPRDDAVTIDVEHDSQTFFSSIFGVNVAPDIGAHAKACAGAAQGPKNLIPIQTDITMPLCFDAGEPQLGEPCPLEFGAEDANPRGIIDLEAPGDYCSDAGGSGDLEDLIEFGADGSCQINASGTCDPDKNGPWYDCVAVQAGNPTKVARAFEDRIAGEGACDTNGDGIESFEETVILAFDAPQPEDRIYEPRDCDEGTDGVQFSVRLISIIVLEEPPTGSSNTGHPIYAFAGFYLMGCTLSDDEVSIDDLDPFCDVPGGGSGYAAPPASSAQFVKYPAHHRCSHQSMPTCTPTPTNTPVPPTNTPAPTNTPGGGGPTATPTEPGGGGGTCGGGGGGGSSGCGHVVVWGRFVNLLFTDSETGPPTAATTIFSISLVE
jgi:hypothetical protein